MHVFSLELSIDFQHLSRL